MSKELVKVGVILDSKEIPLWINLLLEKIEKDEFLEIKLCVYHAESDRYKQSKPFFYRFHEKIEGIIFRNFTNLNKTTRINNIADNQNTLTFETDLAEISTEIQSYKLDVILNLSSYKVHNKWNNLSVYGIWTYLVENQNPIIGNRSVYQKVVFRNQVLKASLHCMGGVWGSSSVIHTSWLATNYNSVFLSKNPTLILGVDVIYRLLKGIYGYGSSYMNYFSSRFREESVSKEEEFEYVLSNKQALINLTKIVVRYLYHKLTTQAKSKWYLMFKLNATPIPNKINGYKYLHPPKDKFWADPFVLSKNNKNYVYIEELPFKTNKGYISLLEVDNAGVLLKTEKIIEKPYHMSYPFVFEYKNEFYMIPETSQNRTIELYKCDEFPDKWSFFMVLMENVSAKDTTLYFCNNKWWLFTAINISPEFSDHIELYLYYSNELFTKEWISHQNNPIDTDIRNSRPAGRIFNFENKIYRPSQDCSERYGKAININQIITLNETSYKEIPVSKLEALWSPKLKGTHTYNYDKNFTVIDVY